LTASLVRIEWISCINHRFLQAKSVDRVQLQIANSRDLEIAQAVSNAVERELVLAPFDLKRLRFALVAVQLELVRDLLLVRLNVSTTVEVALSVVI